MATKIQLRRDLSSNWASTNPILAQGEPGVELDTNNMKIGDGVTAWMDLAYTVQSGGLESVFVSMDNNNSQKPRISTDGINWTKEIDTGSNGTNHSNDWSVYGIAIGNGVIVYRGFNNLTDKEELRYSAGPYQAAVQPVSDITRVGPNGEEITWNTLTFGGGYFVAGGWYYDTDINDFNYPIAAYSADGATWTKIDIDLPYIYDIIDAQRTAYSNNVTGMRISSVTYGTTGWLFTLNYEADNTYWLDDSNRLNPGAFYITSITTDLNSSSYFATMPATDWSAYFDGQGWLAYYSSQLIYRNTNSDPRQGSWTDIGWASVTGAIDFVSSHVGLDTGPGDYYGVGEIAAGELDGVNYMAISDYYGVVYYTADQGTTWNYVTPGPAYAGIYELEINVNGGIRFTNSGSSVNWGQQPVGDWNGEKITISGSYIAELNGTWWIDDYDGTSYPLYSDREKLNRLNSSGLDPLNIVSKYVVYGNKGDNSIILPDTDDIVVGQRIFGINGVLTKEDIDGGWAEPNLVTSVDAGTNRITLKYPLYQSWGSGSDNQQLNGPQTLYFQAVVKYTHGDPINDLIYGGGKFVVTGGDTNRAYFTTNMTDWHFTVNAENQGAFDKLAYGALDINKNALRSESATVTGITNSLTLGDTFNVNIVGMTDRQSNGNGGPYDYYGATNYNTGTLRIEPSEGSWYLGTYDSERSREIAIYTYTGQQQPQGMNPNYNGFDYYDHATSVAIETGNRMFYFDDYYGTFIADNIHIGYTNDTYNEHYDYNHIDNIWIDGNDIYTPDGYEMTIYNMFAPINDGGGVRIHWDNIANVSVNSSGVTITDNGYDWQFTDDGSGVLYAPFSSDIDIGGYWTIGQGNGTVGYPYIGATDNVDIDPYDFVIQAGQSNGPTVNNYWYFNRDGNMQLPPSGRIDVDDFWQIGYKDHTYIGATDNVVNADPYDIQIKVGNIGDNTYFYFNRTGTLQLPEGGDVVDSEGISVLNAYRSFPQNLQSSDYTIDLTDIGKHIFLTGGNVSIPTDNINNFSVGSTITVISDGQDGSYIKSLTGLTLYQAGVGNAVPDIELPKHTWSTVLKIEANVWIAKLN